MPDFKTSLSAPNTQFQQVTARRPADVSGEVDQAIANVAQVAAMEGGKAYAQAKGSQVSGADMTMEEVNGSASAIDDQIQQALATEKNLVAGPLQDQRAAEIKDAELNKFATNDRTLLALRDSGVISTTEARARRTMNLQRSLSNPINNLFRKEFLDAAGDLTGGGSGAVDAIFQFTPEEKEAMAVKEAQTKAKADYEASVTEGMLRTGKGRDVVVNEFAQDEFDKGRVDELNRLKTERELQQFESEELFARGRSGLARGVADRINTWHMESGGKGLSPANVAQGNQLIEQQYQIMVEQVNTTAGVSGTFRDAEVARLDKWKAGQQAMLGAYDAASMDKKTLEGLDMAAKKLGWSAMPELMSLNAINPKYMELFVKSGGQLDQILNTTVGGDRGTQFINATKLIGSLEAMESGAVIEDKAGAIQMFDSQTGMDMIAEASADPTSKVSESLRRIYADAPDHALGTFNGISGRAAALQKPEIRYQVSDAMSIAKQKMDFMLSTKGANGSITAETSKIKQTAHGPQASRVYLDLPEGMEEHQNELVAIYRTIEKHDWMWKYVSEAYNTPADAFNGYMRGEWNVDISPDGSGPDADVGIHRLAQDDAPEATKLSPGSEEDFRLAQPRQGDVAELQSLLAAEEEGAPTEQQEARLTELLEQRMQVRDKKRGRGLPVDPRGERPAQPAVETAPQSAFSAGQFENTLKTFENNKASPVEKSGFDGELWKPHKSLEGGTDTLAYGHKLTAQEAKSGKVDIGGELVDYNEGLTDEQADQLFKQDVEKHRTIVTKAYPDLKDKSVSNAITSMVYQGANVTKWPNTNKSIKRAIKSGDETDWLAAQTNALNSLWATVQTPERALETIHALYPETPIEVLVALQKKFTAQRKKK